MKKLLTLLVVALSFSVQAAEAPKKPADKKEAAAPVIKPKVKKPCKPGQTEEKDGCHEVKKLK